MMVNTVDASDSTVPRNRLIKPIRFISLSLLDRSTR